MNAADFEHIASGVESFVKALGILIGGAWALYTFWSLRSIQKARAEIEKAHAETEKSRAEMTEIEQRSVEQPILFIELNWEALTDPIAGNCSGRLLARLRNDGKRAVEYKNIVARILPLTTNVRGKLGKALQLPAQTVDEQGNLIAMDPRVMRSGQTRTVAFYVSGIAPGSYFIDLEIKYYGLLLAKGKFKESPDEPIRAHEQLIVEVRAPSAE